MGGRTWEPADDAIIRRYYPEEGPDGCYIRLLSSRTVPAIVLRAAVLGVRSRRRRKPKESMIMVGLQKLVENKPLYNPGEMVQLLRKARGLTQLDVAADVGKAVAVISRIENGAGARFDTIRAIFDALGFELVLRKKDVSVENTTTRGEGSAVRNMRGG